MGVMARWCNGTCYGRLVSSAFTARRVEHLRSRIERITDQMLAELPQHADGGVVDLIEHFAYPLPITVICELVGIPEADRQRWRHWSADLGAMRTDRLRVSSPALIDHIHDLIHQRRAAPSDDLLSGMIQAQDDGTVLSDDEMVPMVLILVLAGHETTAPSSPTALPHS